MDVRLSQPSAQLLPPDTRLSGLIFAAFCRDTTGLDLAPKDRFSVFPASPMCSLTFVQQGQLHLVDAEGHPEPALPRLCFAGPSRTPVVSLGDGPIRAMTLCFYPDAWLKMTGQSVKDFVDQIVPAELALPAQLLPIFAPLLTATDQRHGFDALQNALLPLWHPHGRGAGRRVSDWARSTILRATLSGLGQSQRQVQRRIRHLCGLTQQELHQFIRLERLMLLARPEGARIAEVATAAGFADQAHMGRTLRRLTGYSPARINTLITSAEPFWCYRLLGEYY